MMINNIEDLQKIGKGGFESTVKSIGAVTKGFQAVAAEVADHSKKSFEDGTATVEKLLGARTLDGVLELQSDYVKNNYEAFVAHATKIGELFTDMAKESYKPYEGLFAPK